MKIKLNSDDDFPLNKQLNFLSTAIIIRNILKKMVNIIYKFF